MLPCAVRGLAALVPGSALVAEPTLVHRKNTAVAATFSGADGPLGRADGRPVQQRVPDCASPGQVCGPGPQDVLVVVEGVEMHPLGRNRVMRRTPPVNGAPLPDPALEVREVERVQRPHPHQAVSSQDGLPCTARRRGNLYLLPGPIVDLRIENQGRAPGSGGPDVRDACDGVNRCGSEPERGRAPDHMAPRAVINVHVLLRDILLTLVGLRPWDERPGFDPLTCPDTENAPDILEFGVVVAVLDHGADCGVGQSAGSSVPGRTVGDPVRHAPVELARDLGGAEILVRHQRDTAPVETVEVLDRVTAVGTPALSLSAQGLGRAGLPDMQGVRYPRLPGLDGTSVPME